MAFSGHGRYVMGAFLDHTAQSIALTVVDAQTGQVVHQNQFAFVVPPGPDGDTFQGAGWGFSPDNADRTFIYGYTTSATTVQWDAVNLATRTLIASETITKPGAFWQFSPCGDAIGLVTQDALTNPTQVDVQMMSTADGSKFGDHPAPFGPVVLRTTSTAQIAVVSGTPYVVAPNASTAGCPPPRASAVVQPGTATSLSQGGVHLSFPSSGLLPLPVTVTLTALPVPATNPPAGLGYGGVAFSLTAADSAGNAVHTFQTSYTIAVDYTDEELQALGILPSQLNLFFSDGSTWTPVLPCQECGVDTTNHQLIAVVNHMTDFAAFGPHDTTAPVTTATPTPAPNAVGWNNTPVTVTLNATDNQPGGVGVKNIQVALAGATSDARVVEGSTAAVSITSEGVTAITYSAMDWAGNREAAKTLVLRIDTTSPKTQATPAPGALTPPLPLVTATGTATVKNQAGTPLGTLPFSCWDSQGLQLGLAATDAGSGVARLAFAATGAQPIAAATVTGAAVQVPITTHGRTVLTYAATDVAGNTETTHSETVIVGRGWACATPTPSFSLPDAGTLVLVGTATSGTTSYPFSVTIPFD